MDDTHFVSPTVVGRYADPSSSPATDDRMNPKLLATMAEFGLDEALPDPAVSRSSDLAAINAVRDESHAGSEELFAILPIDDPFDTLNRVTRRDIVIDGIEGNKITLHIYQPNNVVENLPAVLYIHGGGMSIITADNRVTSTLCREIASRGVVSIGVDFRNAHHEGPHPYPAGLNDCIAAVKWIDKNRSQLGIDRIVLQGESGGANLALAVALSANRDGWSSTISGVYAMVPYISGGYAWPQERKLAELPSLIENDGYAVNCASMDLLVHAYDPDDTHTEDPLAWPYFATTAEVEGLPPHVISVNELDPLRDEGIAYFRKLQAAGVPVIGRVNLGITHAAESIFRNAASDYFDATVGDIYRFATSL